ncbi:hypothetical protein AB3S75_020248 [Citrus x aurantiifolia]
MASSDDEVEQQLVSDYYFEHEGEGKQKEIISFSALPIQWNENERTGGCKELIYLRGAADCGLQKIFKPVIAWKFDLINVIPEIFVLSKEKSWIKLQKPRKCYEEIYRTILITVHCLSYAKRNPEATAKSIWDFLSRFFCLYEVRPSQNDLVDHMDLIKEALERDDVLAKSKFLVTFLEEKPTKRKLSDEVVQTKAMSGFIVDDMEEDMVHDTEEDESNEEDELFDSVCSFCDNGGDLLCCEGRCMRSFHATIDAGEESQCVSLGLTKDEVEAMQNFFCKNCEYKQHQCFACGKLGSSDKETGTEVFPCVSATCGHFYHPHCVSKLLLRDDEVAADQLAKSIIVGESFTCPLHKCYICKQGENKADSDLQFAVCRRCPKAYHRKCLPRKIAFEDKLEEGIITRAWEGLLPNHRILIYCLKHEIDDEIGTPIRDHIISPGIEENKTIIDRPRKKQSLALPSGKQKVASTKSSLTSKAPPQGKFGVKALKRVPSNAGQGETMEISERLLVGSDSSRRAKATDVSRKSFKGNVKSVSVQVDRSSSVDSKKTSLGERLYAAFVTEGTEQTKFGKQDNSDRENSRTVTVKPLRKKLISELPSLDEDSKRRLSSLMKDAASSVRVEEILKRHKIPSTHAYSSKSAVDKAITLGKVEGSVEAIRTALKKLDVDGSSIEDAKAVCEPEVLSQIFKWKNKLKVYLAPFLHGMRYTSFGRHFTKVDKLQAIVDKLHWYVNDGDMIVDFCCGANDFSCLMKKKLDEGGKNCLYKNYDILPAKNDFNFEKRDWMTVEPEELAPGSRLIMGLNPPFGVKAGLANKFINKALEFNPKLLVLIVPPETERLDRKESAYELVWEDDQFLSGKSFYLPGSVDENDKQMDQWNMTAPPLYLWSHHDCAAHHKALAEKHGHISRPQSRTQMERNCYETHAVDHPKEEGQGDTSMLIDLPLQINVTKELRNEAREDDKAGFPDNPTEGGGESSHGHGDNQSSKISRKRKRNRKKHGSGIRENSPLDGQNRGRHLVSGIHGMSKHSPANVANVSPLLEGHLSKSIDMPSHVGSGDNDCQHFSNKGMPLSSPAIVIDGTSPLGVHSSKTIEMLSHADGYQCDQMPHRSPVNVSSGILEGESSKPIEIPALSGIGDDGYEHFGDGMSHHSAATVIDGASSLQGLSSKSIEMPSYTQFDDNVHQHFEDKGVPHCSPAKVIAKSSLEDHSSKSIDIPSQTGFGSDYQHHEPSRSSSHIGTTYYGTQAGIPNDMGSYGMSSLNNGLSHGANLDERYTGYVRSTDSLGYRPSMSTDRELAMWPLARMYGQDFPAPTPGYGQMGSVPSNLYGNLGSGAEASYRMSTSAMDRYAPRLHQLNNMRMNTFRSEPFMPSRFGFYDSRAPQPGFFADTDFGPGFHPPFPQQGSGGWLDD